MRPLRSTLPLLCALASCYSPSAPAPASRPPYPPYPQYPPGASYPPPGSSPNGYYAPRPYPNGYAPLLPTYGINAPAASSPLPYALAQLGQVENQLRAAVRAAPPPAVFNVARQINLGALSLVQQRMPRGCAPFQAAPGVFVRLDCRRYERIASAKRVDPSNKTRLFKAGALRLDPMNVGAVTPPLLVSGLESLFGITPAPTPSSAPQPQAKQQGPVPAQQEPPGTVDHRAQGIEGPIKDQQLVGACTAFSLSSVMDNAIRRLNKTDVVSSMHVWSRYADATMPSAESRNEGRPLTVWGAFPYDERAACEMEQQDDGCAELLVPPVQVNTAANDPAIQAEIRNADASGEYTIAEVDQIDPIDPDVLAIDLATGKDIWFAMGVSQDAWTGPQVQSTGVVPDWTPEDGGHSVDLAGYRTTPSGRQFLVHNSWGTSWGDRGYAWVSEAMIKAHAQYAYTVKVVDRSAAQPPPTPVPAQQPSGGDACPAGFMMVTGVPLCQKVCATAADCGAGGSCVRLSQSTVPTVCVATNPLTDDDCGDGELVDLVTGQCANACANGGRPAVGLCPFGG